MQCRAVSLKHTDVSEVRTASIIIAINIHLRILTSTIFEWLKLLNKKWRRGHLQCQHLNTKFNPNPQLVQTLLRFLCTDIRSLNIAIFGMAEARELKKILYRDHLLLYTKFDSNIINRFKSCTHFRSLNVCHLGMAEATGLKMWGRGHLQ
jgi:hypothetical protein